jgi:Na+(H+)/acetate symporter ActP
VQRKESPDVNTEKQKQKESVRMRGSIAQASELGFTIASSLLFPLLIGLWIGEKAGNRKLGAVIGGLIGLFTALGALWQMVWKRR